jgi:hypothetical protein
MKSRITGKMQFVGVALVTAISAGVALAADLPKEGKYDITACISGVSKRIAFDATHSAMTVEQSGAVLSNPPGGFLDKGTFYCLGLSTSFGGKITFKAVCEVALPDGGKVLSTFTQEPDGKIAREMTAGTGIYEGITGSGIVEAMGKFPTVIPGTFQNCNHQTGTYKLK